VGVLPPGTPTLGSVARITGNLIKCIQQRHYEMKLLAYTLINVQSFCPT